MEDIELDDPAAPMYEVYLNLPGSPDTDGSHDSPHFVGFLEFFGADHEHGEHAERSMREPSACSTSRASCTVSNRRAGGIRRGPSEPDAPARVVEDAETGELLPPPIDGEPGVHIGDVRIVVE